MREEPGVLLSELTTLRLGGPARRIVVTESERETVELVRDLDARGEPVLVLGDGSNLVISDDGFDGTAVQLEICGLERSRTRVPTLEVDAGATWDDVVALTVREGYAGLEALSGIPGRVGAAPIQNVGAYGQEVAQTLAWVRAMDRTTGEVVRMSRSDCGFAYRDSRFKRSSRYVVLRVAFDLEDSRLGAPVQHAELARRLAVNVGTRVPATETREAVLDLRRAKGMVLDPIDHDTWSAGSFFTNPVLEPDQVPDGAPQWPASDGRVKTSAAWLIEQAGFGKGYGDGPARVSGKHTLALTNRGTASTTDLLRLAREIRDGVHKRFGVELVNEPVLVGVSL
ncbi:MAG: UDP-N-acetylmuramate dehydrogenase [Actinomycetota bacterium]|nr:UDP-N-acetylmuramate dehydrogenase [Actinomycetota bacterium]